MASNLIKAGHSLVVFDLARAPLEVRLSETAKAIRLIVAPP